MGEHNQGMFAAGRWCVGHGEGADEDDGVGDQRWRGGGVGGVPDRQFQWASVVGVGQGGALEADEGGVSECGCGQAGQEQGGEGGFHCFYRP